MSKGEKIFLIGFAIIFTSYVSFAIGYSINTTRNVSTDDENTDNDTVGSQSPASAPLSLNHLGQLVSLPKSDGTFVKGYVLPDDITKVNFPLMVITKPNTNLFNLGEASAFPIDKKSDGILVYNGMVNGINGDNPISWNDLKNSALAL